MIVGEFIKEAKRAMSESDRVLAENKEIDSLVKARGFEQGKYKFDPNPGVNRKEGSIINGTVRGSFTIEGGDVIVFEREMFPDKIWKRICTIMGFKYHVHTDIDKFAIMPAAVEVGVSLVTPIQEDGI